MLTLVIGGSGSGKSAYAEQLLDGCTDKYYIATMKLCDAESRQKAARHRALRAGKGFVTVEQPRTLGDACLSFGKPYAQAALVECLSNLTANEMFPPSGPRSAETVVPRVLSGVETLSRHVERLVLVSNNVFEDCCPYEPLTLAYIRALGHINTVLAARANYVVETAASIPVSVKPERENPKKEGSSMELYIGGAAQNKTEYVLHTRQIAPERVWDHFERWFWDELKQEKPAEADAWDYLRAHPDTVIICDEIGNGIVPADPFLRSYRERLGRLLCEIAAKADRVERVFCGIGQRIK